MGELRLMKEPDFGIFKNEPVSDIWWRELGSFGTYEAAESWLKEQGAVYIDLDRIPDEIVYFVSRKGNFRIVNVNAPNVIVQKHHIFGDILISTEN